MVSNGDGFDALVVGSGIGGLGAAAALSKAGKRTLVLERHHQIGGLTQTFSRGAHTFGPGVHYVGGVGGAPGADGRFGRLLDWLTDTRLHFAEIGSPYDIVRFPDYEFAIAASGQEYSDQLKERFPDETRAIDAYFDAAGSADAAVHTMFAARALPAPVSTIVGAFNSVPLRWALRTSTARAVAAVRDPRLADILTSRWGLCAIPPGESPLAAHALPTRSFDTGAFYPVGGPGRIATTLSDTISAGGGELRTRSEVAVIRTVDDRVVGVELATGEQIDAPVVISAMGAANTARALPQDVASQWRTQVLDLQPSASYIGFYLGFDADIRDHGATPANVWIYPDGAVGNLWDPTREPVSQMFVSFPSLRDPAHASTDEHTAEGVVVCTWEPFASWADSSPGSRPQEYRDLKARIQRQLLAVFAEHFPRLAPHIDFCEISTPLSQVSHVAADRGAMYGLGLSTTRLRAPSLRVRTPVHGLLLGGQDAAGPGLQAAFMGGYMAAATIEPSLWKRLKD